MSEWLLSSFTFLNIKPWQIDNIKRKKKDSKLYILFFPQFCMQTNGGLIEYASGISFSKFYNMIASASE